MLPIVESQLNALTEDLRLLEILVTGPLGLYSDLKMLRESMPMPGTEDLDRDALRERRTSIVAAVTDVPDLALATIRATESTLNTLANLNESAGSPLADEWVGRARRVLERATEKVAGDVRAAAAKKLAGVYVIVDPEVTAERSAIEVAGAALKGGASAVQLRDKVSDKGTLLETASAINAMCDAHNALFFVNDDADVAVLSSAAGLHLGQTDLPVAQARILVGSLQLIGRSNTNLDQALGSQADGVDYVAIGPVFTTETMGKGGNVPVGCETVREVKDRVTPPVVAIGGIDSTNAESVFSAGADAICVASAVTLTEDPQASTRTLVEIADRVKAQEG
jgi:thiamine-phosphate pyrophosphorylase